MWKKKLQAAREDWEAAMTLAGATAVELEAKGEAVTVEEKEALDGLIAAARSTKAEHDRIKPMADLEEEQAAEAASAGRKTHDNRAPAILPEGSLGASKPLSVSNIFRATFVAGSGQNPAVFKQCAGEEYEISNRLKAAGYMAESHGGILFPLGAEWLIEPIDGEGRQMADFTELRKEIGERLEMKAFDAGEIGWTLKRNPDWARRELGLDRKDLSLGDDTLGGYLIPSTQAGRIIDLLRARAVVVRAGAMEVPLPPSGNIAYPKLTSDPTFTYTDPDTTSDLSTTNVGTGIVRLMAKSLRGAVTIPNDLIRYSSPAVEALVRSALATKAALAEDSSFLEGAGSSIAPKGIINYTPSTAETPTAGRITLHIASTTGTDGDTFEPEDVSIVQALYEEGLDPDSATGWIFRPMFWSSIRNKRGDAVTAGDKKGPWLFDINRSLADGPTDRLANVPVYPTVQASKNRAKGASSTLHYLLFGNFRRAIIGRVGTIELAVSEHVKFLQDKTIIRAILRNDLGLEHEESFVFVDDLVQG